MKIQANIKYTFEISARDLTHIRHALNIATENNKGSSKGKKFQEIHDELTKQVNASLKAYQQHFLSMLEMSVTLSEEDNSQNKD